MTTLKRNRKRENICITFISKAILKSTDKKNLRKLCERYCNVRNTFTYEHA